MSEASNDNKLSKFDILLVKQFSEKLEAIKEIEVEDRVHVLSEALTKEALALQQLVDNYQELDDELIDKLIKNITNSVGKVDDTFSSGFFNVKKGDA